MRHDVLRIAVVGLLIASTLEAQAPRRRTVAPQPGTSASLENFILALPASATHVISTVRCTLVDTRNAPGPFGGPRMSPGVTRSFVVPNGPCGGIPVALGYALTFTGIAPDAATVHLKAWATGTPIPGTPTLTLSRGTGANPNDTVPGGGAIEASGSGSVDVQSDVGTDLLIELTAYYTTGLVLNINPGPGLFGGGIGNVMLGIAQGGVGTNELADRSVNVRKINADFSGPGTVLMSDGSSASWQLPPQGTITGVNAGPGLSGGGSTGSVSLNVNFAGTGNLDTAARSDHKHYVQTVIVNPSSTPTASGSNLLNALAGITDASASKPYLLKIEPGIYDLGNLTLNMQPYVTVEGSGELATKITSVNVSTIQGVSNSELSFLSSENATQAGQGNALYIQFATNFRAHHLTLAASGADGSKGVFVDLGTSSTLHDLMINNTAPNSIGIYINSTTVAIDRATIDVTGDYSIGILSSGTLQLTNTAINAGGAGVSGSFAGAVSIVQACKISVSGAAQAYGIDANVLSLSDSEVTASTSTSGWTVAAVHMYTAFFATISNTYLAASAVSPMLSYGVQVEAGSVWIENSRIKAAWRTVSANGTAVVKIAGSRLEGGGAFGGVICAAVWDGTPTFHASTCP